MSRWISVLAVVFMLTMTGCDPQLNIAGAYIPAWLVCAIGGLFCFWVIHLIILKASILPFLVPVPLVYLAVIIACTCGLWLLFFATR